MVWYHVDGEADVVVMCCCGVILCFDAIFCSGIIFCCHVLSCRIVGLEWRRVVLFGVALMVYCVLEASLCILELCLMVWCNVVCNLV